MIFSRSSVSYLRLSLCAFVLASICLGQQTTHSATDPDASATPVLDPAKRGHVVGGDYKNEFFGFELRRLDGWESLSRGQMNVNEAIGREAIGLKAGVRAGNRVFAMQDGKGANVILSILPVPANSSSEVANRKEIIQKALKSQLPNPKFTGEAVSLGDASHDFVTFRLAYTLQDKNIVQSSQSVLVKDHLVDLVITAQSHQQLSAVLKDLQERLSWTQPN
jgi:hypothetical protein